MMTSKEKAQELVNKFLLEVRGADRYNYNLESMNVFIAKQCALISVDEILSIPFKINCDASERCVNAVMDYYEQVKTEIEKL